MIKWISVEDKEPPDKDAYYLVCCDYHGKLEIEIHHGWNLHCVTHWAELPDFPEGLLRGAE